MKTSINFKVIVAAIILFGVVSVGYFWPQLAGEKLNQHDVTQYEGMAKDIKSERLLSGEDAQWTGGMFGGMPAYMINVLYPAQFLKTAAGVATNAMGTPIAFLFFAMVAMWVMLWMFGVDPWVSLLPAIGYGLSTYFILIIGAGHITKMWAVCYAPLMMGSVWMALRGNMWRGAALAALFASLEIGANHPQITYYFGMAMGAMWISECVAAWRESRVRDFAKRTSVLVVAGMLAVGSNFSPLWYTAQHTPDTIRGGSELAVAAEDSHSASSNSLDLEYATQWSYGKLESFNLLIPSYMGGDSGSTFAADGAAAAEFKAAGLQGAEQGWPTYWGDQPFTAGPTYLGCVMIFLAVLGVILSRSSIKWWVLGVCGVMLLLSWGYNFMWFTKLAFEWLPLYSKFRAVSTTLVVVQWGVPVLAALALMELWSGKLQRREALRGVSLAAIIVWVVTLILMFGSGVVADFGRDSSEQMVSGWLLQLLQQNNLSDQIAQGLHLDLGMGIADAMVQDRVDMIFSDGWRAIMYVSVAMMLLQMLITGYIKNRYVVLALLIGVATWDLVSVDSRYLGADNFSSPASTRVVASAADRQIMEDKDLGYRVFNLTVNPFSDATTSMFHRSVGGYHGAKLSRYQDIIERYLDPQSPKNRERTFSDEVLNMLNTRYVIVPSEGGSAGVVNRPEAYGAAWFVGDVVKAGSPYEAIEALGVNDLKQTAIVEQEVAVQDSLGMGEIELVEYHPQYLKYDYTLDREGVAVFSEIYYPKGWTLYVDGVEHDYVRANYILRSAVLPAGAHTVEWRFRAPSWGVVEAVTLCSSLLIVVALIAAYAAKWLCARRKSKQSSDLVSNEESK